MGDEEWAEILVVKSDIEAEIIRTLLESEGIPVVLTSSLARSVFLGLAPISILVPRSQRTIAAEILAQSEQAQQ